MEYRADSRFAPIQWEMALLCNNVSHWLGANLESALEYNIGDRIQLLWQMEYKSTLVHYDSS